MRKFCLVKSHIFKAQQLEKRLLEVCMGIGNSTSILVDNLCGIEIDIASFRNSISILKASKSWTRMECGILVFDYSVFQHFPNFFV